VVFLSSVHLTPMLLSLVLAAFLVVGALASMLSASDPHWWQENLSALGMTDDISALAFNLTLIIAGAIVTIIARYATATLPTATRRSSAAARCLRSGLVLIGIFLALVGVFPSTASSSCTTRSRPAWPWCSPRSSIGLRWLVPAMPRVFILLGYVYIGVIVVLAVFFAIGYYNLTAVEARRGGAHLQLDHRVPQELQRVRPADGSVHEVARSGADMRTGPDAAASDPVAVSS
jgi:hypothetical protein